MRTKVKVELTDTFGGEANYSWVRREEFIADEGMTDRSMIMKAKRLVSMSGVRHKKEDFGDMISLDFKPSGCCQIIFIQFESVYNEPTTQKKKQYEPA